MATEQDSWLEGIGVSVGSVLDSVAQGVEDTASSVAETVASAASSVSEVVGGAVSSVAQTGSSAIEAVEDTAAKVAQGAGSAFAAVKNTGAAAIGTVEEFAGEVAQGAGDAAMTIAGKASQAVDDVVDGVEGMAQKAVDTASDLYQEIKSAIEGVDLPYQFGGIQAPFEKAQEEAQEDGMVIPARPLTSAELSDAKLIFGDSLDYSKIMVDGGSLASVGACRTIGNTVHLTSDLFKPGTSETTTEGKRTLVHELTHVWQYQHQGWTYAPKALWAQAKAAVNGSRNGAYDWKPLHQKGVPFEEWNPEAQAEAVEEYNIALHNVKDRTATREDYEALQVLAKYVSKVGPAPAAGGGSAGQAASGARDDEAEVTVNTDSPSASGWKDDYAEVDGGAVSAAYS